MHAAVAGRLAEGAAHASLKLTRDGGSQLSADDVISLSLRLCAARVEEVRGRGVREGQWVLETPISRRGVFNQSFLPRPLALLRAELDGRKKHRGCSN